MDAIGYLIIAAAAATGGAVSYLVAKKGTGRAMTTLWVMFLAVSALMAFLTYATPGWDALLYLIILVVGCAPAGVGMLIGGTIGRLHRHAAPG